MPSKIESQIEGCLLYTSGCAVNGPGEARQADVGIAGGKDKGVLFKRGKQICAVPGDQLASRLAQEILEMTGAGSKR